MKNQLSKRVHAISSRARSIDTRIKMIEMTWEVNGILAELQRPSIATPSPTIPERANIAAMTLAVRGVSDQGHVGMMSPGTRNRIALTTLMTAPIPPIARRSGLGKIGSDPGAAAPTACWLRYQAM